MHWFGQGSENCVLREIEMVEGEAVLSSYLILLEGWKAGKLVFQVVQLCSPHFLVPDYFDLLDPGWIPVMKYVREVTKNVAKNLKESSMIFKHLACGQPN